MRRVLSSIIALTAGVLLTTSCLRPRLVPEVDSSQRVRIVVIGVEEWSELPCISHACHEYFLVALREPLHGFKSGAIVLVSYPYKPDEPHLFREQLDATPYWTFRLERNQACDATWSHFAQHQIVALHAIRPITLSLEAKLACFSMPLGEFSVTPE